MFLIQIGPRWLTEQGTEFSHHLLRPRDSKLKILHFHSSSGYLVTEIHRLKKKKIGFLSLSMAKFKDFANISLSMFDIIKTFVNMKTGTILTYHLPF